MTQLTQPEHKKEAERAVLGSALISPVAAKWVSQTLEPNQFHSRGHKIVAQIIKNLHNEGKPIDEFIVSAKLKGPDLDFISKLDVFNLTKSVTNHKHVEHYGKMVQKSFLHRQLMATCEEMLNTHDKATVLERMIRHCRSLDGLDSKDTSTAKDVVMATLDALDEKSAPPIQTGFYEIDRLTGGLQEPGVYTFGARSGVGKSTLMANMAVSMAKDGVKVTYFCGEMTGPELMNRMISTQAGVVHDNIRDKTLDAEALGKISKAAEEISELPINFALIPRPSMKDIRAASISSKAQVVIVDHLTRCRFERAESRRVAVSDFMMSLTTFAQEQDIKILLACQLNRATDGSSDRPKMKDLQESGAIEQESRRVMLFHLTEEEKFNQGLVSLKWQVAKNRNGPAGAGTMDFDKPYLRIR